MEYKLYKCKKGEEGNYQILENYYKNEWRTCGVYFNEKDAIIDFNKLTKQKEN